MYGNIHLPMCVEMLKYLMPFPGYLLNDTSCMEMSTTTPLPSTMPTLTSESNTSPLLYVYIAVPIGLLIISVVTVFVLVALCCVRRRKNMALSLPRQVLQVLFTTMVLRHVLIYRHRSIKIGFPKRFGLFNFTCNIAMLNCTYVHSVICRWCVPLEY